MQTMPGCPSRRYGATVAYLCRRPTVSVATGLVSPRTAALVLRTLSILRGSVQMPESMDCFPLDRRSHRSARPQCLHQAAVGLIPACSWQCPVRTNHFGIFDKSSVELQHNAANALCCINGDIHDNIIIKGTFWIGLKGYNLTSIFLAISSGF